MAVAVGWAQGVQPGTNALHINHMPVDPEEVLISFNSSIEASVSICCCQWLTRCGVVLRVRQIDIYTLHSVLSREAQVNRPSLAVVLRFAC